MRLTFTVPADAKSILHIMRDWADWRHIFPRTIESVSLVRSRGKEAQLEVRHRTEGRVINLLTVESEDRVRLKEFKARYDAEFAFSTSGNGGELHVDASVWLKGSAKWTRWIAAPIIRQKVRKYLLAPLIEHADQLNERGK